MIPLAVITNAGPIPLIPEEWKAGLHFILKRDHATLCVLEKTKSSVDSSDCPQQQVSPRPAPHFTLTVMSLGSSYPFGWFGSAVLAVSPPSFLWKLALSQATPACVVTPNVCCREATVDLLSGITTGCLLIWKKFYRWREEEEGCRLSELLIHHWAKISFCVLWCRFLFLTLMLRWWAERR